MYDNIGNKIKTLAKIIFVMESIAFIIMGLFFIISSNNKILIFFGFLAMFIGPIVSWMFSWLVYGFGEIVDKISDFEGRAHNNKKKSKAQTQDALAKPNVERIVELEKLLNEGSITEEEYMQEISKIIP